MILVLRAPAGRSTARNAMCARYTNGKTGRLIFSHLPSFIIPGNAFAAALSLATSLQPLPVDFGVYNALHHEKPFASFANILPQ